MELGKARRKSVLPLHHSTYSVCIYLVEKEEGNRFLVFFISSHFSVPLTHPYFLLQTMKVSALNSAVFKAQLSIVLPNENVKKKKKRKPLKLLNMKN